MKAEIKQGNLLEAPEFYKVHQVNCQGVMGSGIAKTIKEKYQTVYLEYNNFCAFNKPSHRLLGESQCCNISNGVIVNLFGQDIYGNDKQRYTDYESFYNALENLKHKIMFSINPKEIAFPYKIGSDRGGADCNVILAMINSVFENTDIKVTIYKLN